MRGEKQMRNCDRGESLQDIENQGKCAQSGRRARNVGCANVAAAGLADVLSAKSSKQKVPEGDRSQKVAIPGSEKESGHYGFKYTSLRWLASSQRKMPPRQPVRRRRYIDKCYINVKLAIFV